jgi:Multimeric flavodoxin WrbA
MNPEIIAISGSPIPNSNTERMLKRILESSGLKGELVKLSHLNVRPCFHCKKCVYDNICKINDDFPALAEKIKTAKALIIGAYTPYAQVDAFTKALLERFWSFRHLKNLLKGKLGAVVVTSIHPSMAESSLKAIACELRDYENMEIIGEVAVQGNIPCVSCGPGDECVQSGLRKFQGGAKAADFPYARAEDQPAWAEAERIGRVIADRLS